MQNGESGSNIKIAKNMRKTTLQAHYSCCIKELARKNSYYSKNKTILKTGQNGHHSWAIAFSKLAVWVKDLNCQKHAKNHSTSTLQLLYGRNGLVLKVNRGSMT